MAHRYDVLGLFDNDYDEDGFRRCSVTGLHIHRSAENMVKLFGLTAVVAMLVGGTFAFFVAMTRWEVIGLLSPERYYTFLTIHAWNLLIFWMVFLEIAILYVGGPMILGRRLSVPILAKAGWLAMFVGAMLLGAAVWIAYSGFEALHHKAPAVQPGWPLALAIASIPLKEFLFQITRWVGRRYEDISLEANAWHHRSDAVTSLAAAAGLAAVAIGGAGWAFVDAVTAIVLSAFLMTMAVRLIHSAAGELVDAAPEQKLIDVIEQAILDTPGVRTFHALRARKVGGKVTMDLHVLVDPDISVRDGHEIASDVQRKLRRADARIIEAVIHIEPAETD